jgi:hypothetical protein
MTLEKTIYPLENKIIIEFTHFKTFANNDNYELIILTLMNVIKTVLYNYESFEIHVNMFSFNTSSLVKYRDFIQLFSNYSRYFNENLSHIYVYYTPSIMDSIFKIISTHTQTSYSNTNVVLYTKKESENSFNSLFSSSPSPSSSSSSSSSPLKI